MEAVYFGNGHWANNTGASTKDNPVHINATTGRPYGGGPWMGADLETGMYYGGGGNKTTVNNQSIPLPFDFVTGSVKGRSGSILFSIFFLNLCALSPAFLAHVCSFLVQMALRSRPATRQKARS